MTYSQFKSSRQNSMNGSSAREKNGAEHPPEEGEFEQVISIMPNPRARRGSIASAAFPELHHQNRAKEPDTLLLLTRTHTDPRGRRHSVAVPLIPPPYGEKFEGGYHIERNPITGAARLVHPPSPSRATGQAAGGSGAVPKRGRGRRHSIQVSSLSKDMASLKVGEGSSGSGGGLKEAQEGRGRDRGASSSTRSSGTSARKELKELKRASSKRRSSKQGFLHFLDLAIAN